MKTVMLLLVPAVALLISLSVASPIGHNPEQNLKHIIHQAGNYGNSITKQIFVEDVSLLAEGSDRCGNKFFCKVHKILKNHLENKEHSHEKDEEKKIVKNLEIYINSTNVNCTGVLQNVTSSVEAKPIPDLMGFLVKCCQHKNLNSPRKNNQTSI